MSPSVIPDIFNRESRVLFQADPHAWKSRKTWIPAKNREDDRRGSCEEDTEPSFCLPVQTGQRMTEPLQFRAKRGISRSTSEHLQKQILHFVQDDHSDTIDQRAKWALTTQRSSISQKITLPTFRNPRQNFKPLLGGSVVAPVPASFYSFAGKHGN